MTLHVEMDTHGIKDYGNKGVVEHVESVTVAAEKPEDGKLE